MLRLVSHGPADNRVKAGIQTGDALGRGYGRREGYFKQQLVKVRCFEGHDSRYRLVQDDPDGVEVATGSDLAPPPGLFGG